MPIPADTDAPVTMAKATGAKLLRQLHTEAARIVGIADRLRDAVETATDPPAAEAEAVRAVAEQRAAEADQWRAEADAAADEMAAQLARCPGPRRAGTRGPDPGRSRPGCCYPGGSRQR